MAGNEFNTSAVQARSPASCIGSSGDHVATRSGETHLANLKGNLLCGARDPATTFAWNWIHDIWSSLAGCLGSQGIRVFAALPPGMVPTRSRGTHWVEADLSLRNWASVRRTAHFIREHDIRTLYLVGHAAISPHYAWLRALGVRRVVVHDHSSGARTPAQGLKRLLKWTLARARPIVADTVVAVSDYVARRQIEVALIPRGRVVRIWNGVPLRPDADPPDVHARLGLPPGRPLVMCACRATPEKGIEHLLHAFDRVARQFMERPSPPVLVYIGDGPDLARLEAIRARLGSAPHIVFAGYRADAAELVAGATVAVIPSVWQEAFGLSVIEAMAAGRPVIASAVGGIPEIVEDGITGLLVPPGDVEALADAMLDLLQDAERARSLGEAARRRVALHFSFDRQVDDLCRVLRGEVVAC